MANFTSRVLSAEDFADNAQIVDQVQIRAGSHSITCETDLLNSTSTCQGNNNHLLSIHS